MYWLLALALLIVTYFQIPRIIDWHEDRNSRLAAYRRKYGMRGQDSIRYWKRFEAGRRQQDAA